MALLIYSYFDVTFSFTLETSVHPRCSEMLSWCGLFLCTGIQWALLILKLKSFGQKIVHKLFAWWISSFLNFLFSISRIPLVLIVVFHLEDLFQMSVNLSVQFSSVAQSCPTCCDPMNCSTPGLPVHHQLPEFTHTHVHRVRDAIQPSHPLSAPSSPAPNPSQNQSLFQWVDSSHEVAEVLEFQL